MAKKAQTQEPSEEAKALLERLVKLRAERLQLDMEVQDAIAAAWLRCGKEARDGREWLTNEELRSRVWFDPEVVATRQAVAKNQAELLELEGRLALLGHVVFRTS